MDEHGRRHRGRTPFQGKEGCDGALVIERRRETVDGVSGHGDHFATAERGERGLEVQGLAHGRATSTRG